MSRGPGLSQALSWKREDRWHPSEKGQLLLDPPDSPLPSGVTVATMALVQGRKGAGAWTVRGRTEDALASVLPSCLPASQGGRQARSV